MAVKNTGNKDETTVVDDDKEVTEDDLRDLKYPSDEVETDDKSEDETAEGDDTEEESEEAGKEDGKTDDQAEDEDSEETDETESDEEPSEFVKEFPNIKGDTLPDYTRELEHTLQLSNTEGKRLSDRVKELEAKDTNDDTEDTKVGDSDDKKTSSADPVSMFMKQKMQEEIDDSFRDFQKSYPKAVPGTAEYDTFTREVAVMSRVIIETQGRLAPPKELYAKAAASLGWEPETSPTGKDKLSMALKNTAAVSKTTSATKKVPKSKVTDQMIAVNRMMYPGKSDDEIRKELEPHIQ